MASEKDIATTTVVDEKLGGDDELTTRAMRAKKVEETMPLGAAFKKYKKALFWSIVVSMVRASNASADVLEYCNGVIRHVATVRLSILSSADSPETPSSPMTASRSGLES